MVLVVKSRILMAWVILRESSGLWQHGCCGDKIGVVVGG